MSEDSSTPVATETVKGNVLKLLGVGTPKNTPKPETDLDSLRIEAAKFVQELKSRAKAAKSELEFLLADGKIKDMTGIRRSMEDRLLELDRGYPGLEIPKEGSSNRELRGFRRRMERADGVAKALEDLITQEYRENSKLLKAEISKTENAAKTEIEKTAKQTNLEDLKTQLANVTIKLETGDTVKTVSANTLTFFKDKLKEEKIKKNAKLLQLYTTGLEATEKYFELKSKIDTVETQINEINKRCATSVEKLNAQIASSKLAQQIEWSPPADIVFGTRLGPTQLNAVLKFGDGELVYQSENAEKTRLSVGNGQKLVVYAKESEFYKQTTKEVLINVTPAPRTIECANPTATIVYGTPFKKSELGVTVKSTELTSAFDEGMTKTLIVKLNGQELAESTILDVGTHNLTIATKALANFQMAVEKPFALTVQKATQVIQWQGFRNPFTFGELLSTSHLNAKVTSDCPATDKVALMTSALTYYNKTAPIKTGALLDAGTYTLTVKGSNHANFKPADDVTAEFTVNKATRNITVKALKPIESTITAADISQLESKIKLSAGTDKLEFFIDKVKLVENAVVPVSRATKITVVPPKHDNYIDLASIEVDVEVTKRNPVITWKEPKPIVSGTALSATQLNAVRTKGDQELTYSPPSGESFVVPGTEPANFYLNAIHAESDNFERGVKTVRLTVGANQSTVDGYEGMRNGSAFDKSGLTEPQKALVENWENDKDGVKTSTIELLNKLKEMPGGMFVQYMNELVPESKRSSSASQTIWALPNGMQVRYKPNGDPFIPEEMFCVEGRTSSGCSSGPADVAFKVSADGFVAAKGPSQNKNPGGGVDGAQYNKGTCYATHIQCVPRAEPFIEWKLPTELLYGMKYSPDWLILPRDHGALKWLAPTDINSALTVGDDQAIKIQLEKTNKYKEHLAEVKFSVKPARQKIECKKTLELVWGTPFKLEMLSASLTVEPSEAISTAPNDLPTLKQALTAIDEQDKAVEGVLLDAKDDYTIRVQAPKTTNFGEASEPVKVNVKPAKQVLKCDASLDLSWGTKVQLDLFNAQLSTDPPEAATALPGLLETLKQSIKLVDEKGESVEGSVLDAKDGYTLQVLAPKTTNFVEAFEPVKVNIKPVPQKIDWKVADSIQLTAGAPVTKEMLSATVTTEPALPALYEELSAAVVYLDDKGLEVKVGDVLPVGEHKLTVNTGQRANLISTTGKTITITVTEAK